MYEPTKIQSIEPKWAKWVHSVIPAICLHCSIGSVYAFSLFVKPISEELSKSTQLVQFAFSLAIFFLGMSAAFGGSLVEKNIKRSTLVSTICFCTGLVIAGIALHVKSLILLYIGYGVVMGVGLGIGYLSPIKTLMLWFEDNKGLATGISVCAFGFASTIASPIITYLTTHYSLTISFISLACIYFVPMLIAHFLLRKPLNWHEPLTQSDFKVGILLKDRKFRYIWLMIYMNIACGLALISTVSSVCNEIGHNLKTTALVVSIMGIFNGAGRLILSAISDKFKNRSNMYLIVFIMSVIVTLIAWFIPKFSIITLMVISAGYGAGFSLLPSLLSDIYGMKNISKIHGLTLSAWAVAGVTGNQFAELIHSSSNSYLTILPILCCVYSSMTSIKILLDKEVKTS